MRNILNAFVFNYKSNLTWKNYSRYFNQHEVEKFTQSFPICKTDHPVSDIINFISSEECDEQNTPSLTDFQGEPHGPI